MIKTMRSLLCATALGLVVFAAQAQVAADAFVRQISADVVDTVKADKAIQAGDLRKVIALVDTKIFPHVNFQRMTASAVGRHWRHATPEQQKRLQDEFKLLLIRTYAGALSQIKDQNLEFKPLRAKPEDTEVIVRSELKGRGDPLQIDYRVEKAGDAWKIYDLNVLGVWLVETYRSSFAQEISAGGIDGLIQKLADKNKAASAAANKG
jgi:phospholipid transport system substrate-binding protein